MMIGRVANATRVLGKSQGYRGLPIRDETINCAVNGEGMPVMITAWEPTPDEIAKIVAGAPIHLIVLGMVHPPVMMQVGESPAVV